MTKLRFFTENGKVKPICKKGRVNTPCERMVEDETVTIALIGDGWRYQQPAKAVGGTVFLSEGDLKKLVGTIAEESKKKISLTIIKREK